MIAEREMTPDRCERLEREQFHHEDVQDSAGPTSDAESEETPEPIMTPVVVGNPE